MSIIIKGMEMPTSCTNCPFEAFGDCYGGKVKRIMDIEDYMERGERHPDCPLVVLPEHGDLIDRDAFLRWLDMQNRMWVRSYTTNDLREMLRKGIPTIIPATEEVE